jgi:hypothetical protein
MTLGVLNLGLSLILYIPRENNYDVLLPLSCPLSSVRNYFL